MGMADAEWDGRRLSTFSRDIDERTEKVGRES
jgi:hypothetical protein